MIGKTNLKSGGGEELNVFVQKDEPSKKDGVWIKTEEVSTDIVKYTANTNIPYSFFQGKSIAIGTDVYIFGSNTSSYYNATYKYNTLTDTYTRLTNIPYSFYEGGIEKNGTDIYLFGGQGGDSTAYKYDTLTDTYTQLANIPSSDSQRSVARVGNYIYIFYGWVIYKYDITNNVYEELSISAPYLSKGGPIIAIGTDIYMFGSTDSSYKNYAYKYNTLTNTNTRLTNIPFNFNRGAITNIGNYIYLGGSDQSNAQSSLYRYDIVLGTYTQLTNLPYSSYDFSMVTVNDSFYILRLTYNYKATPVSYPEINKLRPSSIDIKNISLEDIENEDSYTQLTNISYDAYDSNCGAISPYVYIFGGENNPTTAYKYNTLKDTYTSITSVPYNFRYGCKCITVGRCIYLFGGQNNYTTAYKYNPSTNQYTPLTNIPYSFADGCVARVNSDIYLFSGDYGGTTAYKYNTITDTYTQLADLPYNCSYGSTVGVDNNIYLIGDGSSNGTKVYKYNTLTNTYTQLTEAPVTIRSSKAVEVNGTIIVFAGQDYMTRAYQYDIATDSFTRLTDVPYSFYHGCVDVIGLNVYLFSGGSSLSSSSRFYAYRYNAKFTLTNNEVAIFPIGSTFSTKLSEVLKTPIEYALIGQNNEPADYPCYYGDGTSWNLIEK